MGGAPEGDVTAAEGAARRRRRARRRRVLLGLSALALLLAAPPTWGFGIEPALLSVRRVSLALPGWPATHGRLRIAAIADLHAGAPHVSLATVDRVVARTRAEQPDLVVLLGDFVITGVLGGTFVAPEPIAEHLRGLRAPLGTFAVLGNHDGWLDAARVRRALEHTGVTVLENAGARVERGGRSTWLYGVEDLMTGSPDVLGALRGAHPGEPTILLTHNPDVFPDVPRAVAVTLAGHTHGGQVDLPGVGRPIVPSRYGERYAQGHVVEGGRHLFVTTGVGTSIVPVRFGVRPEIAIVTLVPGGAD